MANATLPGFNPRWGVPSGFKAQLLSDDPDTQVAETLAVMQQYASEDAQTPEITAEAREALAESHTEDPLTAVWNFVRSRMSFLNDGERLKTFQGLPVVEEIVRPRDMHTWWIGDCDDYSSYAAALLMNLGVKVSFCTVAADAREPQSYSHVYLVAYYGGKRVPMDFSHGQYPGWETPNRFGKRAESSAQENSILKVLFAATALVWAAEVWSQ